MNLTRAELDASCNTEEAARTCHVQPKPRPVQPFNTARVELSTPRATPKISAHASRTCPVLKTRASQITDTVRAKTRAEPLSLLHGPCNCPMCERNNAHASLARSVCRPVQVLSFCFLELCTLTDAGFLPKLKCSFNKTQSLLKLHQPFHRSFLKAHQNPN